MNALPSLTGLRAFDAVARHLNFGRAAEELGVTPTAISHAVHALETQCGVTLFRRRPRPLALTREGEELFPAVSEAFSLITDAVDRLEEGASAGRLKVTATNAFAARCLVPRLPLWREAHPGVRLDVIGTDTVLDLSAAEADVSIRYGRFAPAGPDLENTVLTRDTFHVVATPGLVATRSLPLSPTALSELPLIDYAWPASDTAAPTWQRWEDEARRSHTAVPKLASRVVGRFAEELHAIQTVIAGQGIAICSDVLVGDELGRGDLVRISDVSLPGYSFHVVFRRASSRVHAARQFRAWLDDVFGSGRSEAA